MAQNPYLQNLLGIGPPLGNPMGLMRYEYTQPNYQNLLNQGLTASQIQGYDPKWATFGQFPYVMDQATNQVSVPGQAPGVTPITTDTQTDTVSESVTPSGIDYSSDVQDTVSTPYGDFTSDDFTQDIYTYPTGKPLNQMTEQELIAFGKDKKYIDRETGRLTGPMQTDIGKFGLWGGMAAGPGQAMNENEYQWFLDSLNQKGMMLGGAVDAPRFAQHSQLFQDKDRVSVLFTDRATAKLKTNPIGGRYGVSKDSNVKIPGTFKYVEALKNQYAPSGRDENDIVYHTGSGGYYLPNGKFMTGYGQVAAHGSMQDAIDLVLAADASGNYTNIPQKFLTEKWKNIAKNYNSEIGNAVDNVIKGEKKQKKETTRDMTTDQHVRATSEPKQKVTKGKKDQITKQSTGQGRDIIKTKTIPSRRISSPKSSPTYSPGHPSQR